MRSRVYFVANSVTDNHSRYAVPLRFRKQFVHGETFFDAAAAEHRKTIIESGTELPYVLKLFAKYFRLTLLQQIVS